MKHYFRSISIILLVLFSVSLLISCVPSFQIVSLSDEFSDPSKPYGFIGKYNRLSTKSSQGGKHIDDKGVYLEPFVYKNRQTKRIDSLGFYAAHYSHTLKGGFRPIEQIIFLTNKGERVAIKFKSKGSDYDVHGWNIITKEFNTSYSEKAIGYISKSDFAKLANAKYLEAKIMGGKRSQTYSKKDISQSFIINLKAFYDSRVR